MSAPGVPRFLEEGPFRHARLLGRGSSGSVYRAHQVSLDRDVIVKVLEALDDVSLQRFDVEARLLARISHPRIVRLVGHGVAGDQPYLVYSHKEGETLQRWLERTGRLPWPEALPLFRDLLEGLEALHQEGILHRDIKPANLWIEEDRRLLIIDFGLGRAGAGSGITRPGEVVGTPGYLSPEQALGEELDPRSDLYAAGLVMFRTLFGNNPFDHQDVRVALALHVNLRIKQLPQVDPEVPARLEDVVGKLLQSERRHRFPSARACLDVLSAPELDRDARPTGELARQARELRSSGEFPEGHATRAPGTLPAGQETPGRSSAPRVFAGIAFLLAVLAAWRVAGWSGAPMTPIESVALEAGPAGFRMTLRKAARAAPTSLSWSSRAWDGTRSSGPIALFEGSWVADSLPQECEEIEVRDENHPDEPLRIFAPWVPRPRGIDQRDGLRIQNPGRQWDHGEAEYLVDMRKQSTAGFPGATDLYIPAPARDDAPPPLAEVRLSGRVAWRGVMIPVHFLDAQANAYRGEEEVERRIRDALRSRSSRGTRDTRGLLPEVLSRFLDLPGETPPGRLIALTERRLRAAVEARSREDIDVVRLWKWLLPFTRLETFLAQEGVESSFEPSRILAPLIRVRSRPHPDPSRVNPDQVRCLGRFAGTPGTDPLRDAVVSLSLVRGGFLEPEIPGRPRWVSAIEDGAVRGESMILPVTGPPSGASAGTGDEVVLAFEVLSPSPKSYLELEIGEGSRALPLMLGSPTHFRSMSQPEGTLPYPQTPRSWKNAANYLQILEIRMDRRLFREGLPKTVQVSYHQFPGLVGETISWIMLGSASWEFRSRAAE